jgi:hypothetical protein
MWVDPSPRLHLTNFRISLKSANLPDGRRAKAAIRLENRQALGMPFLKALFAISRCRQVSGVYQKRSSVKRSTRTATGHFQRRWSRKPLGPTARIRVEVPELLSSQRTFVQVSPTAGRKAACEVA